MPIPWGVWAAMIGMQALGGLLSGMKKPTQPRLTENEELIKAFRSRMETYRATSSRNTGAISRLAERYSALQKIENPTPEQSATGQRDYTSEEDQEKLAEQLRASYETSHGAKRSVKNG